jgi:hypothetical protein
MLMKAVSLTRGALAEVSDIPLPMVLSLNVLLTITT